MNYHSLFYYHILAPLRELQNGRSSADRRVIEGQPVFDVVYEPRLDNYAHNYLRQKHLNTRAYLIVGRFHPDSNKYFVVGKVERAKDEITIYTDALKEIFANKYAKASKELIALLEKFYNLTKEERSGYTKVDYNSSENYSNSISVDEYPRI